MTKKRNYILLSVLLFSLAVTFIDAVVQPPYFSKIPIKILFFLALPMVFFFIYREEWGTLKALFKPKKKGLLLSVAIGVGIYCVILGGYFALRSVIDFSGVTSSLTEGMGITADNFLYVAIYISIMNSFLEEFFFRGFGFAALKKYVSGSNGQAFAWLFSPFLFALYHAGMLVEMFHPAVLCLLMAGLVMGGLIFNWLNNRFGNLYPSWLAHIAANFAINTIGFILFGVV